MRQFSTSASDNLNKKQGVEPVVFIGIDWFDGAATTYYSSTEFAGTEKSVVSISDLETTQRIEGSGATQSTNVILSDTSGKLADIMNNYDVQKRPAKVYLGFPNVPLSESVLLLDGEINSPIKWDERSRTLSFTILSKIEGRLFGFAAEDGLFQDVDSRTRSTPWPFRFGETCAYPAVEIRNGRTGLLRIGQGVLDATLDAKICQAQKIECPRIPDPLNSANEPSPEDNLNSASLFWDVSGSDVFDFGPTTPFGTRLSDPLGTNPYGQTSSGQNLVPDRECERGKFETLCQLYRDRANQLVYVNDTLLIRGGNDFPQGQTVDIRIDDVVYTGSFSGEVFTIEQTDRRDLPTGTIDCQDVSPLTTGYRQANEDSPDSLGECQNPTNRFELRVVGGAVEAWEKLDEIADSGFKWLPSGSTVYLESSQKRVHIVSMVTGTVDGVFAYRTFGDTQQLTEVPADYYEVVTTDYGGLSVVEIHLDKSLKSYVDEGWEDKLYVQFTSDIGPNVTDVIEWIVDNYTDYTVDASNFSAVSSLVANYPCNYYHAKKSNVLDTLTQIAYEARCALTITDNVVKLTYLPAEPTADVTLTNADIVAGSFSIELSRTDDLITADEVSWEEFGASVLAADDHVRKFTVENNVDKYGWFGDTNIYETIKYEEQALKTATFWSIRNSNTWKYITFSTTLQHMNIELYDCIQFNTRLFPNMKVVVVQQRVDVRRGTVQFTCWTPVLSGTNEQWNWAWPASEVAGRPYPSSGFEAPAPPIAITPPEGHPLYIDSQTPAIAPTRGERYPSDADDTAPTLACQDMTDPLLIDTLEPIFNRIGFPTDPASQASRAEETGGLQYSFQESEENIVCGRNSLEASVWEVTVQYATATKIGLVNNPQGTAEDGCGIIGGPCVTDGQGVRCSGPTFFWCRTFGSETMAQAFRDAIASQINQGYCSWRVGNTGPVSVQGPILRGSASDPTNQGLGNTQVGSGATS